MVEKEEVYQPNSSTIKYDNRFQSQMHKSNNLIDLVYKQHNKTIELLAVSYGKKVLFYL